MVKKNLWVYHRPNSSALIHWSRRCRLARGGPQGSRMISLDAEWQELEGLTDAPPSIVVSRAQQMFAARICPECVPATVRERLVPPEP